MKAKKAKWRKDGEDAIPIFWLIHHWNDSLQSTSVSFSQRFSLSSFFLLQKEKRFVYLSNKMCVHILYFSFRLPEREKERNKRDIKYTREKERKKNTCTHINWSLRHRKYEINSRKEKENLFSFWKLTDHTSQCRIFFFWTSIVCFDWIHFLQTNFKISRSILWISFTYFEFFF